MSTKERHKQWTNRLAELTNGEFKALLNGFKPSTFRTGGSFRYQNFIVPKGLKAPSGPSRIKANAGSVAPSGGVLQNNSDNYEDQCFNAESITNQYGTNQIQKEKERKENILFNQQSYEGYKDDTKIHLENKLRIRP